MCTANNYTPTKRLALRQVTKEGAGEKHWKVIELRERTTPICSCLSPGGITFITDATTITSSSDLRLFLFQFLSGRGNNGRVGHLSVSTRRQKASKSRASKSQVVHASNPSNFSALSTENVFCTTTGPSLITRMV